jgi:hypothetical protein
MPAQKAPGKSENKVKALEHKPNQPVAYNYLSIMSRLRSVKSGQIQRVAASSHLLGNARSPEATRKVNMKPESLTV